MKKGLLITLLFAFAVLASCNKNINRNIRKAIVTKENEAWVLNDYRRYGIGGQNEYGRIIKDFQFQLNSGPHFNGNILSYENDPSLTSGFEMPLSPTSNDSVKSEMRIILNDEKERDHRWGYMTIIRDSVKYRNSENNSIVQHYVIQVYKLNKKEFQFLYMSDEGDYGEIFGYYGFIKKEIE